MNKKVLDIFVIGGGVNGVAIARDAAGRGLNVALAERGTLHPKHLLIQLNYFMAV